MSSAASVSVGSQYMCVLHQNHRVHCTPSLLFQSNRIQSNVSDAGWRGDGTAAFEPTESLGASNEDWLTISVGLDTACGIKRDFKAHCFRLSSDSQSYVFPLPLDQVDSAATQQHTDFIHVAAGRSFACGVTSMGRAACWANAAMSVRLSVCLPLLSLSDCTVCVCAERARWLCPRRCRAASLCAHSSPACVASSSPLVRCPPLHFPVLMRVSFIVCDVCSCDQYRVQHSRMRQRTACQRWSARSVG